MRILALTFFTAALCMTTEAIAQMTFNVMSFNVRYGTAMDGENHWRHRKDILVETIRRGAPDILGLQECLEFQAEYIVETLPEYRWIGIGRDPGGKGEMTAVLYNKNVLVPLEVRHFWLSETPDVPASISWDSSLTRMATHVRFQHIPSGVFIHCINTHFDHRGEEARARGAEVMVDQAKNIPEDLPLVILGDFNASAEKSRPWTVFQESGYQDAWIAAENREGPPVTWGAFKAPEPDGNRIDWILFRGPLAVQYAETILYNKDGRYPSDHYPVLARFALTNHPE